MAKAHSPSDLAARINTLIERHFEKNVLRAATSWGVPQPTVYRLAAGLTDRPQRKTLERIAAYHETSADWLLDGEGPSPLESPALVPIAEYRDFRMVVEKLDLEPRTKWAVLSLPDTIGTAHYILCQFGIGIQEGLEKKPDKVTNGGLDAARKASALVYLGWANYLTGLINFYGRGRVREKLESEFERAALGFHPVSLDVLNAPGGSQLLRTALQRHRVGHGMKAGVILQEFPKIPPLDAVTPTSVKPKRGRPSKTRPHRTLDDDEITLGAVRDPEDQSDFNSSVGS